MDHSKDTNEKTYSPTSEAPKNTTETKATETLTYIKSISTPHSFDRFPAGSHNAMSSTTSCGLSSYQNVISNASSNYFSIDESEVNTMLSDSNISVSLGWYNSNNRHINNDVVPLTPSIHSARNVSTTGVYMPNVAEVSISVATSQVITLDSLTRTISTTAAMKACDLPCRDVPSTIGLVQSRSDPMSMPQTLEENFTPTLRKRKNRCQKCFKRIGLLSFTCHCGGSFCSVHRYTSEHSCSFDFKREGRKELLKCNPQVIQAKIRKL